MRVRVLHAKLYAYALPGSTARQLFNRARHCSTARQLATERSTPAVQRPRQTSTPRHMQSASTCLDGLDSYSTATRQLLDNYSTATRQLLDRLDRQGLDSPSTAASTAARRFSTEPRQLDSSTARAQTHPPHLIYWTHGDTESLSDSVGLSDIRIIYIPSTCK